MLLPSISPSVKDGRNNGRNDRRIDGLKEGGKDGKTDGRKEGTTNGSKDGTTEGKKERRRLEIMYNSKQFVNHEYRTVTLSSLFSQIGGSLGLYLGASIITVVEIVTFVASWLWYRIYPLRNIKVHQNSTPSQRNMKDYNLYSDNKDYF
ncbi:uncharacterized protein CDAR_269351 [Caerostris darwini]|uniref:Uncharacterized protein n=1 Tax=Caerostris darwini TaxID=1538125 RepID=A0AAV4NWT3_9ARAC|nr:uncharacterized protein CDAR_269351 [Caerostris darwini]